MEKNTLGTFLWITVTVIVMLTLVAFASPFGIYVRDNIDTFTGNYIDENKEEIPVEVAYHTITVKYNIPSDANTVIPDSQQTIKEGESYKIISPEIIGYTPDKTVIEGVATEETEIVVTYSYAKYEIKFVTNNGNWDSAYAPPSSYIYKSTVTLPNTNNIQRQHYTFVGWYLDENFTKPASNITPSDYGDKTFYAKWVSTSYNITFNLNDTEDEGYYYHPDTKLAEWDEEIDLTKYQSFKYGEQIELPKTVNKFGYTFEGWSLEKDGKDKTKWRTQITESDSGNIVLYAQYSRNTYNIYYDVKFLTANNTEREFQIIGDEYTVMDIITGKTRTEYGYPKTYTYGEVITLPTVKLEGYDQYTSYEIWFDKDTEKITVNSAGKLPNDNLISGYPSNMTQKLSISDKYATQGIFDSSDIYVHIKPIPNNYYIKFDKNSPKTKRNNTNPDMATQIFTYDLKTKLNKNTYKFTGYTFNGWNTKADGTGNYYANEAEIFNLTTEGNKTITLYAQWTANDVNVTYKYYFQNITDDNYTLDSSKNVTKKYKADSNASLSSYIKEFKGFTAGSTKYYDPLVGETDISTHSSDNGLSKNRFYVLPDGTTEIRFYFTRNTHTLTLVVTPGNMFKTATGSGGNMSSISLTTGSSSSKITTKREKVKYGSYLTFSVTYEAQHKLDGWTTSLNNKKGTSNTFNWTMTDEDVTITLTNAWNKATITFKPNATNPSASPSTDQTQEYIYNQKYGSFPSVSRTCYTFSGWYTASSGGTKVETSHIFDYGDPTTLYARWTKKASTESGHDWVKQSSSVEPWCETKGRYDYKCSVCGQTKSVDKAALKHYDGRTVTKAATCIAEGSIKTHCGRCDVVINTVPIAKIPHTSTGQCKNIHNTGHSMAVNWGSGNHTCVTNTTSNNKVCFRHATCHMCGTFRGFQWCVTHGYDNAGHNISGCKRTWCVNNKLTTHTCKTRGSGVPSSSYTTDTCPGTGFY